MHQSTHYVFNQSINQSRIHISMTGGHPYKSIKLNLKTNESTYGYTMVLGT